MKSQFHTFRTKKIKFMRNKFILFILLICVKQINAQFCINHVNTVTVPPNQGAFALCTADFDTDGNLDIVATSTTSLVAFFHGTGTGFFNSGPIFSLTSVNNSQGITNGDFNKDGNMDIAVTSFNSSSINILMGNGAGSFGTPVVYSVQSQSKAIKAYDFNGDNNLDLAMVNAGPGLVTIMLGSSTGTFTSTTTFNVGGTSPYDLCLLDFNGDGKQDIAVANFGSNNASFLAGNGNGSFQAPMGLSGPVLNSPYGICSNDFNGDGKADIAVSSSGSNNVIVYLGNGTGGILSSFQMPITGTSPRGIASADFNGDGNSDIVTTNFNSGNLSFLAGPSFSSSTLISGGGAGPRTIVPADFNGDGRLEVATVDENSGTMSSYINNFPYLTVSSGSVVCNGDSAHLSASGVTTYSWSTGASTASITVAPSTTTSYSVTGTNTSCGQGVTKVVTVTVNPLPSLTLTPSPSATICSGQQETLTAAGASTYTWTGSISNGTAFTPTASATYSVSGTDLNGCAGTNSIHVTVNATPTISINASANAVCPSTPVTLTATGGVTYTWSPAIANGVAFVPSGTTTYTVIADNGNGCTSTAMKTITVYPAPTLSITATPTFVCHGTPCTLTASGSVTSYTWSGGVTNGVPFYPAATGGYTVNATDANGCQISGTQPINVSTNNLAFSVSPQNGVAPLPVTITNSTPSLSNYNFTWYFGDGSSVSNNNASVFYTYNFAGLYDVGVIATNTVTGCKDTLVKTQYVNVSGSGCSHTASVTPSGPLNKCQGDTVILTAVTNAPPTFTLQWNFNGVTISGATTNTLSVTQSGYYSVTVTKSSCPVTSSAVQINFATHPATPVITSQGSIIPCVASVDTLFCSPMSGVTYLWSTSQTTSSITVSSPGIYNVTVTNSSSCTATSSYTVASNVTTPAICIVTNDSASINNIIMWDKTSYPSADSFIVYRETGSNVYSRIGAVSKDSLSQFIDVNRAVGPANGDPNIGYYHYKLQMRDVCGNYSQLSPYHSTVFFADLHTGVFSFNIYDVEGQPTPVSNFYLYRDSANIGDWRVVGSVAGTTTLINDPNYSTYQSIANWRVYADGFTCTPTLRAGHNSTAGAVVKSKSNICNNRTTGSNPFGVASSQLTVYPNPGNGNFVLKSEKELGVVTIYNSLGEIVYQTKTQVANFTIDISKQPAGIYILQAQGKYLRLIKE
jgi:hypothetical protein